MVYCSQCGAEITDEDAQFCSECGASLEEPEQVREPASDEAAADAIPAASKQPERADSLAAAEDGAARSAQADGATVGAVAGKIANFFKADKKRVAVIGGIAVVVVVLVIVFALTRCPVSTNQLKQDMAESSLADGLVSATYTDDTAYEFRDVKVKDYKEYTETFWGVPFDVLELTVDATAVNESFESQFVAEVYYVKSDNQWQFEGTPDITESTTIPIKGVDYLEGSYQHQNLVEGNAGYTVSDFQSSFEVSDAGVYTSTATERYTYEYWFADDVCTKTRSFTFDPEEGWVADGDEEVRDTSTTWKLSGKTFTATESEGGGTDNVTSTLTFGDVNDGELSVDYTLAFDATDANAYYTTSYYNVDLAGTATGVISHEFGEANLAIDMEDVSHSVSLECAFYTSYLNCLFETETPYRSGLLGDDNFEPYLSFEVPTDTATASS